MAGSFLVAFLWSARSGQYDDDYTPSVRMLFEDAPKVSKEIKEQSTSIKDQKNQLNRNQD